MKNLKGVDLIIGGHDHRPLATCDFDKDLNSDTPTAYVNPGARCMNLGHAHFELVFNKGKRSSTEITAEMIDLEDVAPSEAFDAEFEEIRLERDSFLNTCDFGQRELQAAREAAGGAGAGMVALCGKPDRQGRHP